MEPSTELEILHSNPQEEDSDEVPTSLFSPASPKLREDNQLQINFLNTSGGRKRVASGSSSSSESIKKELKGRCHQLEIQKRTERGHLEKQLDCAISERREAERKYEDLLKKVGQSGGVLNSPRLKEKEPTPEREEANVEATTKEGEGVDSLPELVSDSSSSGSTDTSFGEVKHLAQIWQKKRYKDVRS